MKKVILTYLLLITAVFSATEDDYCGYWELESGKAVIELVKENNEYSAYVRWIKEEESDDKLSALKLLQMAKIKEKTDTSELLGKKIAGGFKEESSHLSDGWLFDLRNGLKYYSKVEILDLDTLKLKASLDKSFVIAKSMEINRISEEKLQNLLGKSA